MSLVLSLFIRGPKPKTITGTDREPTIYVAMAKGGFQELKSFEKAERWEFLEKVESEKIVSCKNSARAPVLHIFK